MYRICALIILAIIALSCQPQTEAPPSDNSSIYLDSLQLALDNLHKIGYINGFGVAIANSEGTLYEAGYGTADVENAKNYTENTLQNIASISKTFIGIALMKAQEMGLLQLDDPVNQYLPFEVRNPNHPEVAITLRQLATHTSSIVDTDLYDEKSYIAKTTEGAERAQALGESFNPPSDKTTMAIFLEKLLSIEGEWYDEASFLDAAPGQQFDYSNVAATLAALAIEGASKQSYPEFTKQHIFEPLGMNQSAWSFDQIEMSQHSFLYAKGDTTIPFYSLNTYPDGGLLTSPNNMAKYLSELIKGKLGQGTLLKPESYEEYFTPYLDDSHFTEERDPEFPYSDEYSMGIFMGISGMGNIGHSGGDPGINSLMFFNPEKDLGCYMVINTSIYNQEGVDEFYGIMQALFKYGEKF